MKKYNKEYLKSELIKLLDKYGTISTVLIDEEENFPTRKVFNRVFGSLENAYKAIGYTEYKIRKFTIEEAQKYLDQRNGQFILLTFNGVRAKNKTKCKKCGYEWDVSTDSLYRNNTKTNGCPNCLKIINEKAKINREKQKQYEKEQNWIYKRNKNLLNSCLNNELNFYYFLGLLLSDGHFDLDKKRIRVVQKEHNLEILVKLSNYYNLKINKESNNVYVIDFVAKEFFDLIVEKYKISNKKTYFPCDLTSLTGEAMLAFVIGFIDGDGCITKLKKSNSFTMSIKLYQSWLDNLELITKTIYKYFDIEKYPKVFLCQPKNGNGNKYAEVIWSNQKILFGLYKFILNNNLIYMSRKWDKLKERINNE